jgi:hypothetical protein
MLCFIYLKYLANTAGIMGLPSMSIQVIFHVLQKPLLHPSKPKETVTNMFKAQSKFIKVRHIFDPGKYSSERLK